MSVKCPRCSSDNPDGARFCNICGTVLAWAEDHSGASAVAVRCLKCGAMNSSDLRNCGSCGADMAESVKAHETRPSPPSSPLVRQCPSCGREVNPAASVCAYCGADLASAPLPKVVHTSPNPVYAAILMFGTGALGLFSAVYNLVFSELPVELQQFEGIRECCGGLTMLLAAVCIMGGFFALRRQHFIFAMIGAIAGMMTVGLYVGFIMSLVALVLLAISQKEFES